jgi:hypothetical protein
MQKDRYSEDRVIEIKGETKTLTVKDNVTVQETLSASKVEATDASQPSTFAGNVTVGGAINANSIQTDGAVSFGGSATFSGSQFCNYIITSSSSYNIASDDYFIVCVADSATITLPALSTSGRVLIIKNNTNTSLTIEVSTSIGMIFYGSNLYSGTSTTAVTSYSLPEHKTIMLIATSRYPSGIAGTSYWITSYL